MVLPMKPAPPVTSTRNSWLLLFSTGVDNFWWTGPRALEKRWTVAAWFWG
jgi:hypothetical protein